MERLDENTIGLLSKRAYFIIGSMTRCGGKTLAVHLNRKKLPLKDFRSYLGLFDGVMPPAAFKRINERSEVGVGMSVDQSFMT